MKMGSGTTKKAERVERKKKKLNALLEITKLNNKDRSKEYYPNSHVETVSNSNEEEKEEGEIDDSPVNSIGPHCKRQKTNDGGVSTISIVPSVESSCEKLNGQIEDKPFIIPADELIKLRKELRDRRNRSRHLPKVRLNEMGEKALLIRDYRTPLFMSDIQHLIMFSQLGLHSPVMPRWCSFDKLTKISHTVVCVIEGATVYDYISTESTYQLLANMKHRVEIVSPVTYNGNLVEELATVPLSKTQIEKLERKYGSLQQAELTTGLVFRILRSIFPIDLPPVQRSKKEENPSKHNQIPSSDRFPRTELLLSAWQMIEEEYPIPVKGELQDRYSQYVMSKDKYAEVTPFSPMWGLDCEMCYTIKKQNELTRISIVDENHQVVYESLVKPPNKIINYLTQYSGITAAMMKNVTKTLEDVQRELKELLPPDVILVGQSLNCDLHALRLMHPYVIDTSIIYNLSGVRLQKAKLATLAREFLGELIQTGHGHDSVEDSSSSLKLVQLKLANSVEFGDAVLCGSKMIFNSHIVKNSTSIKSKKNSTTQIYATSLFSHVTKDKKHAAVVGKDEVLTHYRPLAMIPSLNQGKNETLVKCQPVLSNKDAILYSCKEAQYNSFFLTHLKLDPNESLNDIDMWCSELYRSLAHNGFLIVILAGSQQSKAHGACFLHIKNDLNRITVQ